MHRRDFLIALAAIPAACGSRKPSHPIGLQLYTIRRELENDFDGSLERAAAIGFTEVEFAGYHGRTPSRIRKALEAHGLTAPSAHVSLQELRQDAGPLLQAAHTIGHRYLVLGWLAPEDRTTLDDYKRVVETLNRAGARFREAGIQLGYHNHDFEFAALENVVPYDLILQETSPDLVTMELDLYWVAKAGSSAERYLSAHARRFALVHVKDMDRAGRFTEVGRGVLDFAKLLPLARRAGVRHFFVEQDETPGSPFESIAVSYANLRAASILAQ
jgi:sugar phosphate isomerase/epimerase